MTVTQTYARVQIAVPGRDELNSYLIDVPLPDRIPIADCVVQLVAYLRKELADAGKDVSWLTDHDAAWHLETFGEQPLDNENTLRDEKIYDGTRLYLVKTRPGEKYEPLIDDLAESITYWLRRLFPSWDNRAARRLSLITLPVVVSVVCLAATYWCATTAPTLGPRIALCVTFSVPALIAAAIAVITIRTHKTDHTLAVPLLVSCYLLAGCAALLVTPRPLSVYQLVAAGSTLLALSVCLMLLTNTTERLHYGVGCATLITTTVAALNTLYRSPSAVVATQLITIAFVVVLISSRIALAFARISIPYVPATGEHYVGSARAGDLDAGNLPRDNSGRAAASQLNQKEQISNGNGIMFGMLAGALTVLCFSAFVAGRDLDNHRWLIFSYVIVMAVLLVYRGKRLDDARLQTIVLIAAATILVMFSAGLLISAHETENAFKAALTLAVLVVGVIVATIYAVRQRRIVSPIILRVFEMIEKLLYASPFVFVTFAMDAFQRTRGL